MVSKTCEDEKEAWIDFCNGSNPHWTFMGKVKVPSFSTKNYI